MTSAKEEKSREWRGVCQGGIPEEAWMGDWPCGAPGNTSPGKEHRRKCTHVTPTGPIGGTERGQTAKGQSGVGGVKGHEAGVSPTSVGSPGGLRQRGAYAFRGAWEACSGSPGGQDGLGEDAACA